MEQSKDLRKAYHKLCTEFHCLPGIGVNMLEKILEWGKKEEAVRALILLGSRADRQPVDHFSDGALWDCPSLL